jgi:hypothetical protein
MIEIVKQKSGTAEIDEPRKETAYALAVQALPLLGETFKDDKALVDRVHGLAISFAAYIFDEGERWIVKE